MTNQTMPHFVLQVLVLVVMASQWATLHCRSATWDSYNQYVANEGTAQSDDAVTFTTELSSSDIMASFAKSTETYNYADSVTFSARNPKTFSERADETAGFTEGIPSYDTYVDSPETVKEDASSLADQTLYKSDNRFNYRRPTEDDEVFFDTSAADTIYKAPDADGLSLAAYNISKTDDMLVSLAKALGGCGTGNPIDDCWRCDPNWRSHRQALASCAIGFGRNAIGGKNGKIYVVTTNGDDAQNPAPGTLRYGVTRPEPLWIIFATSMTIQLKAELIMTSFKTIDGRGATVHIVGGSQITIQGISNVIIHGIHIHDIHPSGPSTIRVSPSKLVNRGVSDGDGIHIQVASYVWVDHCYLARAADGLIDATHGSTMITISNNYFTQHNKVMLFGSHPTDYGDRNIRITVAFNTFGPGLIQRMPRCRFGTFHVVNNDYTAGWGIYAIGGSEDPTILSEGNHFNPAGGNKEVTKRINDNGPTYGGWQKWNWASGGDVFLGGAYFTGSGAASTSASVYAKAFSFSPRPGQLVPALTASAGPLSV